MPCLVRQFIYIIYPLGYDFLFGMSLPYLDGLSSQSLFEMRIAYKGVHGFGQRLTVSSGHKQTVFAMSYKTRCASAREIGRYTGETHRHPLYQSVRHTLMVGRQHEYIGLTEVIHHPACLTHEQDTFCKPQTFDLRLKFTFQGTLTINLQFVTVSLRKRCESVYQNIMTFLVCESTGRNDCFFRRGIGVRKRVVDHRIRDDP